METPGIIGVVQGSYRDCRVSRFRGIWGYVEIWGISGCWADSGLGVYIRFRG